MFIYKWGIIAQQTRIIAKSKKGRTDTIIVDANKKLPNIVKRIKKVSNKYKNLTEEEKEAKKQNKKNMERTIIKIWMKIKAKILIYCTI